MAVVANRHSCEHQEHPTRPLANIDLFKIEVLALRRRVGGGVRRKTELCALLFRNVVERSNCKQVLICIDFLLVDEPDIFD